MNRLYYKFLYRHIMRFLHKYNWHYMEPNPWIEHGKIHYWCQWCGLRTVENVPDKSKEITK